jgi:hypothetical protein
MYSVNKLDKVIELANVPRSSVGAPLPLLLSNEGRVVLAYYIEETSEKWDGTTVRMISSNSVEPVAIVEFKRCYAHMFGAPNDEAFSGHPLAERGLGPYRVYEIENSFWIRQLERMNSVHPYHKPERFWERHHYIFAFHDSTFECVADEFFVTTTHGSMESILPMMAEKLWAR